MNRRRTASRWLGAAALISSRPVGSHADERHPGGQSRT